MQKHSIYCKIDSLRNAASKLTNNPKSITVQTTQAGGSLSSFGAATATETLRERIALITNFTMKTAAQYKVIDDIWSEFKFWTVNLEGYQDMSVSFPKKARETANE
ncbi:hypothetical protein H6G89_25840 [Oscillatoria sp. FACHB-1407]|uniref:hypothetical protein n=1 Tax=Oscillatoria sp. FACHB-1407 TaxID=2692847 RepID=UPI001685C89E|nr:hypothetical protein [Oscillatoria sp. FACHB-1407]MBD2464433.1 hypothetical protein [Oscillatoria sp. FACHB-1407]